MLIADSSAPDLRPCDGDYTREFAPPKHFPSISQPRPNTHQKTCAVAGVMLDASAPTAGRSTRWEAFNMKITLATLVLLALFASTAAAQSSRVGLVVRCPVRLPTQGEVATAIGTSNFSQTYTARERLMAYAQRTCRRSGLRLRVIADGHGHRPLLDAPVPAAIK